MKLLLFSDLHVDLGAAKILGSRAAEADVLVGAGDFATGRKNLRRCLDALGAADRPAVFVAGNNESTEELVEACQDRPNTHVLHGSAAVVEGMAFYGIGGGIPVTPFGAWSWDFTEDQAEELLAHCPAGCVLVSHSPPLGAVDRNSSGKSIGSTAVRAAVERLRPRLVVCGHVHASGGWTARIGATPVVNAGPEGILWDLDSDCEA